MDSTILAMPIDHRGEVRGKFIVFEGVEGSGKTTQLAALAEWLLANDRLAHGRGATNPLVIQTREPGGTALGKALRHILLSQASKETIQDRAELLLYAADRAQHVETILKPYLRKHTIVLCDRYVDSTITYQGYGRGLDIALIEQINQLATAGLTSDLTLWLDVDAKIGLSRVQQRGDSDRIEQAELAFHQRVAEGYRQLAQQYPDRIVRIDASLDVAHVARQIREVWRQRFPELS
jgi:dTMP kinase